jgi:hypothetical protein
MFHWTAFHKKVSQVLGIAFAKTEQQSYGTVSARGRPPEADPAWRLPCDPGATIAVQGND